MAHQLDQALQTQLDQALEAYKQGNYEEARQQFSTLAANHAEDAEIRLWLGAASREAGYLDTAGFQFQEVLRLTRDPQLANLARASLVEQKNGNHTRVQLENSATQDSHQGGAANNGSDHSQSPLSSKLAINASPVPQPTTSITPEKFQRAPLLEQMSLRAKATALAIALSVLPVLAIGTASYFFFSKGAREDAISAQEGLAITLADVIGRYMRERVGDIQLLSGLAIFNDAKLSNMTSRQEKEAQLNRFVEARGSYDSAAVFDRNGNVIAKSKGQIGKNSQGQITNNIKDRDHFQAVLKTDRLVISQPSVSKTTGKISIFVAAPVKDITGKTVAVARTRMPVQVLDEIIKTEARIVANTERLGAVDYHLVGADGRFFIAYVQDYLGKNVNTHFANFAHFQGSADVSSAVDIHLKGNVEQLVTRTSLATIEGLPDLNWSIVLAEDTATAFAAERRLLLTLLLGIGLTALLVGAIAAFLARRATRPILDATDAVKKLGQGRLDTRVVVQGEDELAELGSNINLMAEQIQTLLLEQAETTHQQLMAQEQAARQQAENAEQQRLAKENLQKRALELLLEVDPVSRGDLTIRAKVTEDEIGTVADSYNATIASLRQIVAQVQAAAQHLAKTTSASEASVEELSTEALRQTEEITTALNKIQQMSSSIRAVAASAQEAEAAVQQANQTVSEGDEAMNRTVGGILALQETVTETSKKLKRLGESSQEINKVVKLISRFAAQTNLLALNASIEATRAGEEGRGFVVVANEVRTLARQSAAATAEIAKIVSSIQSETNEVVAAMEVGREQVATGTQLVDETRQSLNKITAVSTQISALVEVIAQAAAAQSQASESVTHTMSDVAAISHKTSTEAGQVSASFKNLLAVAQELQSSAGQFKVS